MNLASSTGALGILTPWFLFVEQELGRATPDEDRLIAWFRNLAFLYCLLCVLATAAPVGAILGR